RKAVVHLAEEGVKGELQAVFHDQDALMKRLNLSDEDEFNRKKDLENEAKGWLPEGSTAKLKSLKGFDSTEDPIEAWFDIDVPNFGSSTAHHLILPLNLFGAGYYSAFEHDSRKYPIYFSYPYQEFDQVLLEVPVGYAVEILPANAKESGIV